jgi:hypothetical protein
VFYHLLHPNTVLRSIISILKLFELGEYAQIPYLHENIGTKRKPDTNKRGGDIKFFLDGGQGRA